MQPQATDASPQRSARFWAWTFLVAGVYALACIPAVLVFEHFRWFEAPLHITSFCACILAVTSAIMYLVKTRGGAGKATMFGVPTRLLAFVAILLAGGFLLFVAAVIVLLSVMPNDF